MCLVSNVGDRYTEIYPDQWPKVFPKQFPDIPNPSFVPKSPKVVSYTVDKAEFDKLVDRVKELEKLKSVVEQMKLDLEVAKQQDNDNNEPDCEMEDKVDLLKKVAKLVGVDLSSVWP
jgi:hypothetical protein